MIRALRRPEAAACPVCGARTLHRGAHRLLVAASGIMAVALVLTNWPG